MSQYKLDDYVVVTAAIAGCKLSPGHRGQVMDFVTKTSFAVQFDPLDGNPPPGPVLICGCGMGLVVVTPVVTPDN